MKAVILAGGKGTRLAPYTTVFPKPMLPLGDKPILETIIRQLKTHGFKEITLAVGYLSDLIRAYFGDGSSLGIAIKYSKEEKPLGTAGPLAMIRGLERTFLVMNGDILSAISFRKLIAYHRSMKAIATIAVNSRSQRIDYGVIEKGPDGSISGYREKPELDYTVSMGIYVFEPAVFKYIRRDERIDLPSLVLKLIKDSQKVAAYVSDDYWLDIGRPDDYQKAQEEFSRIKGKLLNAR